MVTVPEAKWSEQAFGKRVVAHLMAEHWDVYQEVQMPRGGPVADIVAICGPVLMVCELKRSLSFALIAQADHWKWRTNVTRVFTPPPKRGGDAHRLALDVCRDRGIGVSTLDYCDYVQELVSPALRRASRTEPLRKVLSEEHKHYAQAGSAKGGHWTPFKRTVARLKTLVAANPGVPMKEAFDRIEHHYASSASARSRIRTLVDRGVIKGIEIRREGRKLVLFPTNSPEEV